MAKEPFSRYIERAILYGPHIRSSPSMDLALIVVIPSYNEKELITTLASLTNCTLPNGGVEVIIIINDAVNSPQACKTQNLISFNEAQSWAKKHNSPSLKFYPIYKSNLPSKFAGVGLARKIGLDEGILRFHQIEEKEGVLVCLDADSQVKTNYLVEIEKHFANNPKTLGAAIHYEHPIEGNSFSETVYGGIIQYELHLRYFIEMQKGIQLPFAYQTVGSSMAVRSNAYCAVGGMNRRKAGEDFYFFHKFIKSGKVTELFTSKVIPSPRVSDRVPFGTGRAIGELVENPIFMTYQPRSFELLHVFLKNLNKAYIADLVPDLSSENVHLAAFLEEQNFDSKWQECVKHTSDWESFRQRFYHWFDAFLLMKYLHFMRDKSFPNIPIQEAVALAFPQWTSYSTKEMLLALRKVAKTRNRLSQ